MKFKNILAVAGLVLLSAFGACAQGQFDTFAATRTVKMLVQSTQSTSTSNANYADIHGWIGTAKIDIATAPDLATATMAVTVQTSDDTTNWITMPNVAFGVSNSVVIPNLRYGTTNFNATNNYNLAGTVTTPAATSGFTTPYIGSIPAFTSSAIFTNTGPVLTTIGFHPDDQQRYVRFFIINGGSGTNFAFSATLTGFKQQQ